MRRAPAARDGLQHDATCFHGFERLPPLELAPCTSRVPRLSPHNVLLPSLKALCGHCAAAHLIHTIQCHRCRLPTSADLQPLCRACFFNSLQAVAFRPLPCQLNVPLAFPVFSNGRLIDSCFRCRFSETHKGHHRLRGPHRAIQAAAALKTAICKASAPPIRIFMPKLPLSTSVAMKTETSNELEPSCRA